MQTGAHFSRCRRFRYALWRQWGEACGAARRGAPDGHRPMVMLIGLNPSTADATSNDPTIRRCIGFARDWGFGRMWVLNLFAFRATYPTDLKAAPDPVGPRNDWWLRRIARQSDRVVACWGNDGGFMERSTQVRKMLGDRLEVIRLNAGGEPAHPLYLPKGLKAVRWLGRGEK